VTRPIRLPTLLVVLAILFVSKSMAIHAATIESLIMPGELIKGHAKVEHECSKCHDRFDRHRQSELCLDCHKEINKDIKNRSGYHGKKPQIRQQKCKSCHTEHKGRNADIVKLDKLTFDHAFTDFPLRGQHSKTSCNDCHKTGKKYSEAPHECYRCHADNSPHKSATMGKVYYRCDSCHDEKHWRNIHYDHDKTKFSLLGAHKKTDCTSCHVAEHYVKTPVKCFACHQLDDVHQGSNGTNCKKCHNAFSWKKIKFDHDKDTDFPLRGRHIKVVCEACHKKDPYKVKIKSDCYSCHKHEDKHAGRFGRKCQDCHSERGWKRIRFDHNRETKFRLRGKHSKVECTSCHKQNIYKVKLKMDCVSCHKLDDVHKGQQGNKCDNCHNEYGWRNKVRFDHDITKFPLIGLHVVVPCEECHLSSSYKDASIECYSCHKSDDTHHGKLGLNCDRCHTPNGWKIWRFDHNTQSQFKLDGKHKGVHCYSCHTEAVKFIDSTPRTCINCHRIDDVHSGQFGSRCDRCHTTTSFKDIEMDRF
jgi:hypothetical protein